MLFSLFGFLFTVDASLMKQWHSTHQRTSSLDTTRSLFSSSLARTTEWVKETCWEPAGKCVWAYVCVGLYCTDFIYKTEFTLSTHCSSLSLKISLFLLFSASVPPLSGVSMWGTRLPLCSELSKTCPTESPNQWASGGARTDWRSNLHPALVICLTQSHRQHGNSTRQDHKNYIRIYNKDELISLHLVFKTQNKHAA